MTLMVTHSDLYPLHTPDPMFHKQQGTVHSLILSLTRLLLLSGDVEPNPGPLSGKIIIVFRAMCLMNVKVQGS